MELTPTNIFMTLEQKYGYSYFPNNFSLSFAGKKLYHNPKDQFWR